MDDILASIRKIIAEDPSGLGLGAPSGPSPTPLSMDAHRAPAAPVPADNGAGPLEVAPPRQPVAAADDLSDLIEGGVAPAATKIAEQQTPIAAPEPLGASLGALAASLATLGKAHPQPAPSQALPPRPAAPPEAAAVESAPAPAAPPPAAAPVPPPAGAGMARTFEDAVSDMMRPMLQRWIDENLPALAERIVREQIRERGDKA